MAFYYYLLALPLVWLSYLCTKWLKRKIDNLQQEQQEQDDEEDDVAAVELITPAQRRRVTTSAPARREKTRIAVDRGESFEARIDKAKLALLEHIHYDHDNDPDSSITFSRPMDGVYRVQSKETGSKTSVASEYFLHLAFQLVDDHRWNVRGHAKTVGKEDSQIIFVVNEGFVARKSGKAYWIGTNTADHTNCTRHVTQGCFNTSHASSSFQGTFEYDSGTTGIHTSFRLVKADDGGNGAILAPSPSCHDDGRSFPVAEAVAVLVVDEDIPHAAGRPFATAAEVQRKEETGCNGKSHCIV